MKKLVILLSMILLMGLVSCETTDVLTMIGNAARGANESLTGNEGEHKPYSWESYNKKENDYEK